MRHYDCGVSRRSAQAGPVRQFESSVPSSLAISIPSPILAYRVWSLNSTHTVHPIRTRPNSNLCLILLKVRFYWILDTHIITAILFSNSISLWPSFLPCMCQCHYSSNPFWSPAGKHINCKQRVRANPGQPISPNGFFCLRLPKVSFYCARLLLAVPLYAPVIINLNSALWKAHCRNVGWGSVPSFCPLGLVRMCRS